jgi:hypothetical protein
MSSRLTIIPPSKVNSGSGGRSRPKFCSEPRAVEGDGLQHAAADGGARLLRIIIRIGFYGLKLNLGIRLEILDRLRTTPEKRVPQVSIFDFRDGAGEIVGGVGQTVIQTGLFHVAVGGNPDHAAGPRRRSADKFGLFDDKDA